MMAGINTYEIRESDIKDLKNGEPIPLFDCGKDTGHVVRLMPVFEDDEL